MTTPAGSTTTVPLTFPALTGTDLRLTFDTIQPRTSPSYETSLVDTLPIAVAEVDIPGVTAATLPARVPTTCRSDLLTLDGRPLWTSVAGSAAAALAGNGLVLSLCGPDAGITLAGGTHLLSSAPGATTGLNVDQLVLDSAAVPPSGRRRRLPTGRRPRPAPPRPTAWSPRRRRARPGRPPSHVASGSSTAWQLHLTGATPATAPFVLVLGESLDRGWAASVDGAGSLGGPYLVDGFANGWTVDAGTLAAGRSPRHRDPRRQLPLHPPARDRRRPDRLGGHRAGLPPRGGRDRRRRRRRRHGVRPDVGRDPVRRRDRPRRRRRGPRAGGRRPGPIRSSGAARCFVRRAPPAHAVVAAVVLGGGAWAVGGPFAGVVAAVGVVLTLTVVWGRTALRVAAVALMAGGALDVVFHQDRYRYPAGGWPTQFDRAATLMWGAVMLLAADAALEMVRAWRAGRSLPGGRHRSPAAPGPELTGASSSGQDGDGGQHGVVGEVGQDRAVEAPVLLERPGDEVTERDGDEEPHPVVHVVARCAAPG